MGEECSAVGRDENGYKILVVYQEGKRSLWIPKNVWGNYIRMSLREIEWEFVDWIHLERDQ
jgi:hypothetical protein